jgi:excisionase family DNA binding protein
MAYKQRTEPPLKIDIPEAARLLGVDAQTIRKFIADGRLPAYRVGDRLIRLNRADVEAMLVPIK